MVRKVTYSLSYITAITTLLLFAAYPNLTWMAFQKGITWFSDNYLFLLL